MPTKQPTAPQVKIAKPTRGKGEPPKSAADTPAAGNNTSSGSDTKLVDLGFKVSAEYRKNYRLFCATHDLAQVDALKEAMADYMQKKGWKPGQ